MDLKRLGAWVVVSVVLNAVTAGAQTGAAPAAASEAQRLYETGERALGERRYADAERAYEQLRQQQPAVAEVHARLGLVYFQQSKFAAAVPALRRALELKPALPNLDALLAMSLSELGQHTEALPALARVFQQSKDPVLKRMAGLHLQRSYTALGKDSEAVGVALALSAAYPDDPEVLYHGGRIFANFAYLQTMKLARVAPGSVWLHQAAGEANESQGLYDAAIREYRQVLALAPGRPGMHFRIGRALLSGGKDGTNAGSAEPAAAAEFERELEIDPTNANAAYELGELRRKAGEFDKSIALFKQALTSDPEFKEALVGLGRVLLSAGQPAAAVPHLQKAVQLDPENIVAFFQLSQAFRALGNVAARDTALASFQRLRERKREHESALLAVPRADVTQQELEPQLPQ
jgi:tetratricopeptide (TPR) repeat protein